MVNCSTWLRDKRSSETRRYASIVIVNEIALRAPTLLYDERKAFMDDIKAALYDPKLNIREAAAEVRW